MSDDALAKLRDPFPAGTVGILPKPYKKDSPRGHCDVCGGFHGLPAVHLDYVGHAPVTDRLLTVDPHWTWEPLAVDQFGNPVLDDERNLWIKLTVCGVTRIGVGDGPSMKERIGDALRNAAMRFGVALSLWSKDELESGLAEVKAAPDGSAQPTSDHGARSDGERPGTAHPSSALASEKQIKFVQSLARDLHIGSASAVKAFVDATVGRETTGWNELTKADANLLIETLTAQKSSLEPPLQDDGFGHGQEPF